MNSIGRIFKTVDGGTNWSLLTSGTTNSLSSVYFTDANTGYAVGENGTILKTTNGGGYPAGFIVLPFNSGKLNIHPNPSSGFVTIETSETHTQSRLSILNLSGQEVLNRQITEPETKINISNLQSGVYFVRLTNDRTVEVGKIIKD